MPPGPPQCRRKAFQPKLRFARNALQRSCGRLPFSEKNKIHLYICWPCKEMRVWKSSFFRIKNRFKESREQEFDKKESREQGFDKHKSLGRWRGWG